MRRLLLALLLVAAFAGIAHANPYTCSASANTCTPQWGYTESKTYTTGAALTDLQDGLITVTAPTGVAPIVNPATSPAGGGAATVSGAVPVAACAKVTLVSNLVERTKSGGISTPGIFPPLVLDRTILRDASGVPVLTSAGATQPDPACFTPNPASNLTVN